MTKSLSSIGAHARLCEKCKTPFVAVADDQERCRACGGSSGLPAAEIFPAVVAMAWGGDRNLALRDALTEVAGDGWAGHMVDQHDAIQASHPEESPARAAAAALEEAFPQLTVLCERHPDGAWHVSATPGGMPAGFGNRKTRRRLQRRLDKAERKGAR